MISITVFKEQVNTPRTSQERERERERERDYTIHCVVDKKQ
jgi:hypothetical protein